MVLTLKADRRQMSDLCADQVRAGGGALPITELGVSVYVYLENSDSVSMASGFSALTIYTIVNDKFNILLSYTDWHDR